jgi:hypothetical protein
VNGRRGRRVDKTREAFMIVDHLPPDARRDLDWHVLLLGLAGRLDDAGIARCRRLLAAGRRDNLVAELRRAVSAGSVALSAEEAAIVAGSGGAASRRSRIAVPGGGGMPGCESAAVAPDADIDVGAADAAAVEAAADVAGAVGLWRAFRLPGRSLMGRTVPVYIVETDHDAGIIGLAAGLQRAIEAVGLPDPPVEVYPTGLGLPAYHRLARARGGACCGRAPPIPESGSHPCSTRSIPSKVPGSGRTTPSSTSRSAAG